jgi:hypothetical protein
LCPDCAAIKQVGRTQLELCATCGNQAQPLQIHRSQVQSFGSRVVAALSYPLRRSVVVSMAGLAAFQALLSYRSFGPPQAIALLATVSAGAFWSYFFLVMSTTASGERDLGVPDFRDIRQDLVMPAWKGFAAGAWVWAPAALYLVATRGFSLELLDELLSPKDPVLWAIAALGAAYVPVALMAAATDSGILDVINPVRNAVCIYRIGREYWLAVGALGLLFGAQVLVQLTVQPLLASLPVPYVCRVLATGVGLYVPFVMSRILGSLLYLRGDVLDWGQPGDYYERALGKVVPRGAAPASARAPQAARAPELAVGAPEPAPAPSPAPPAEAADPDESFRAGVAAAQAKDFAQATRALKSAAFSGHAIAPRAMVTLAQVYAAGLGDPASAAQLYRETIRRFPDTDAARFAQDRLKEL